MSKTAVTLARRSQADIEEGTVFAPKFDAEGLIPVVTTSAKTGELLMLAYPETREMVDGGRAHSNQKRSTAWKEFSENRTLLRKYRLTRDELSTLKRINTMGKVGSARDFLFVLMAIRQALSKENR